MASGKHDPFDRTRNFALPQLYYDANSLLAGALETLPAVRSHPNYQDMVSKFPDEATRQRTASREDAMAILLARWNPKLAFVSPHTLLEVLDVATRRYDLPPDQAIKIVSSGIERDFTLMPAEFEMVRSGRDIVKKLEERISESWQLARVRYRAMARDGQGNPLGLVAIGEDLTSGAGHASFQSGSPKTFEEMKSLDAPQSHTVSAAKFERELFLGAAQLSMEHRIHATDALHILLCMGKGMILVTSDEKLLKKFPRMTSTLPEALTPVQVFEEWGHALDPPWRNGK